MLKWIGIGLVIGGCTAFGSALGRELQKRVSQMMELRKMAVILQGEIRYGNATLNEAFHHTAHRIRPPFREFLEGVACQMEEFEGEGMAEIFRQNMENNLNESALKKDEQELLYRLGESIGYLDVKMQLNSLDLFLEQLNVIYEEAVKEKQNKTKVYHYLGLMGGIFLTIVLI